MLALSLLLLVGTSKEIGPSANLFNEVAALMPGDELILQGGTYGPPGTSSGFWNITVSGNAGAPIVIRSKTGERAHYQLPGTGQNIVNISGHHLVFRDLEFSGGSRGLRFQGGASFDTVERCDIHGTADVAVAANDTGVTYDGMRFVDNHVHHTGTGTGEGFYLGCNNADCRFINGVVQGNWVHDMLTASQGDGIELKEGSYGNVISDNVIHDTKYPCITLYSASLSPTQRNVVERNVMWHCGDHGIQVSRDAVIRNNIVLSAASDGISLQVHVQVDAGTGNVQLVNNTVLAAVFAGIAVRGALSPVLVANNAVYGSGTALLMNGSGSNVTLRGNVTNGNLANDFVAANLSGSVPNDVFPKLGGALVDAGDPTLAPADDFNGSARGAPMTVGAHQFAAMNPGWTLDAGPKPHGDAGVGGAGGGSGSGGGTAGAGGGSSGTGGGSSGTGGGTTSGSGGGTGGGDGGGSEPAKGCGCSGAGSGLLALACLMLIRRSKR